MLLGADPQELLDQTTTQAPPSATQADRSVNPQEEELKQFVSVVLAKSEDVWHGIFYRNGLQFTYGTSAQRLRWFQKGYETGDIGQADTFSARNL